MVTEICLAISIIFSYLLIFILGKKFKEKKITKIITISFAQLIIWCAGVLVQKVFSQKYTDYLIYFDYITYIGICTLFPTLLYLSYSFINGEKKFPKCYILLFIVPLICLIFLWTNDYHNLFYKVYSTNFSETEYGIVFYINTIYSYTLAIIFILQMVKYSIHNSGFLSKQTLILIIGSLIPLVVNVLGTTKIINISIYVTPISFVITLMCYALAIFKYKVLNITPIALKTIMDTMTDAFVVISQDGTIVDFNKLFKEEFIKGEMIEKNYIEYLKGNEEYKNLAFEIEKCITTKINQKYSFSISQDENTIKYYDVDISPIFAKNNETVIGILLLIKDVTQHMLDISALEEKQEIIAKQAQLVSIGELAGGVAHDINTPISAIKTGITMLKVKEDRDESEKQVIDTMENCSNKIINIVNSMRNQIRNLGGDTSIEFKISDVVNDIRCITYHEISKYRAELEINIEDDLSIKGDPAKLGQVLTNLVMNAAQAYKDKNGGKINIVVMRGPKNTAIIKVIDFAKGIPKEVASKIFKSMLTTKGNEGTGLGLYLAYSVIKGNFNGEINFDTEQDVGTTFYIKIPLCN